MRSTFRYSETTTIEFAILIAFMIGKSANFTVNGFIADELQAEPSIVNCYHRIVRQASEPFADLSYAHHLHFPFGDLMFTCAVVMRADAPDWGISLCRQNTNITRARYATPVPIRMTAIHVRASHGRSLLGACFIFIVATVMYRAAVKPACYSV